MKTDKEAFEAYFRAWQDGWPHPADWFRDDDGIWRDSDFEQISSELNGHIPLPYNEEHDYQALIGALVVELAKNPSVLDSGLRRCLHRGLPGVVGLWLEATK
jgi:hypothetical protein